MMISHQQAQQYIQKSLQNGLTADEMQTLADHLRGCSACAQYESEMRRVDQMIRTALPRRWPERRHSPAQLRTLSAAIDAKLRRKNMAQNVSRAARLSGAAVILIVFMVGLGWWVRRTTPLPGGAPIAQGVGKTRTAAPAGTPGIVSKGTPAGTPAAAATGSRVQKVPLERAEDWVREKVFQLNPSMNPQAQFPLNEITPAAVWQRMQVQLFKVTDGVQVGEAYLIAGDQVFPLGTAFGGTGVDAQILLTDLDQDGQPEMVYTFSFGSGIQRSGIGLATWRNGALLVQEPQALYQVGLLRLTQVSDQLVKVDVQEMGRTDWEGLGQLDYQSGDLRILPKEKPWSVLVVDRYGISLAYPTDWKYVDADVWEGESGRMSLRKLSSGNGAGNSGDENSDISRACALEANRHGESYGANPTLTVGSMENNRDVCLIQSSSEVSVPVIGVVFSTGQGEIGLLQIRSEQAAQIVQSLRPRDRTTVSVTAAASSSAASTSVPATASSAATASVPATVSASASATAAATASAAATVAVSQAKWQEMTVGALTLRQFAVVSAAKDTPSHMEFRQRIPAEIAASVQTQTSLSTLAERDNPLLKPFGFILSVHANAQGEDVLAVSQNGRQVQDDLSYLWPVSVQASGANGGGNFVLVGNTLSGAVIIQKDGVQPWDDMAHRSTRPVYVGEHLITVGRGAGADAGSTDEVLVQQDGQTIFRYRTAQQVEEPVKTLSAWNDAWVLEVNGVLVVNGEIWNESKFKADEIFNWTMLNGKPFFFFRRGGSIGAWYDGHELPVTFDALIHDRCCEPAMFNVVNTEDQIQFYAEQNGTWYLNIFR